jgi:hypothetical protein
MPRSRRQTRRIKSPHAPPRRSAPDPGPHRLGDGSTLAKLAAAGDLFGQLTDDPRPHRLNAAAAPLTFASEANRRTMSPSTWEETPTPGRGIEVWSHPRRRWGGPAAAGHGTIRPGVPMATHPGSWRPPPRPAPPPPTAPRRPRQLLLQRVGRVARGAHGPRGRGHPPGRTQPALPGGRARRAGRNPHRPQYPHPETSAAGLARLRQLTASQR